MPWPATHILIAEEYHDLYFKHLDHKNFIIGTSFPDIRYPANLKRGHTHFDQPTITEIQSENAFQAGMLFHSLVDNLWNEEFWQQSYLANRIPHNPAMMHTLKILQDVFIYDRMEGWDQISDIFTKTIPEESLYGVPASMVIRWHRVLSQYLSKPPQFEDINMLELSLLSEVVDKIREYYQEYHSDPSLKAALIQLFDAVRISVVNLVKSSE